MVVGEATGARGRTRARKRLHAPLRYLKTETPAASAEVLYVARQRFVWGGKCVCVSRVEEEGSGGWARQGLGGVRTSSSPASDAVRAATIQQPAGTSNKTPTPQPPPSAGVQIEGLKEEKKRDGRVTQRE